MAFNPPYLMFLGDAPDQLAAKVANGVRMWRPDWCVGQFRMPGCQADLGLKDITIEEAAALGCKTVVVGVANRGGFIPESWVESLLKAIELGMDVASGLHNKVAEIPALAAAAEKHGRGLFDVRHPSREFEVANGVPRPGKRLLTVGTDCSVGKMFTSLAVEKEMKARNMNVDFRATGQTGIFIAGDGVSVDAVVADFIAGATEWLCPANSDDHWDVVEGQGSLFHASYAGVSLGLLHGSQADALVVCHEPTRPHMRGLPDHKLPSFADCIAMNEACGKVTNPNCRVIGVSVNTQSMEKEAAKEYLEGIAKETGLPSVDAFRFGAGPLVDNL